MSAGGVRPMNESLWLAADPSMSLTDLTCELIQMGVPDTEALPWQEKMLRADVSTVAQLLKLTMSQFEGASSATLSPFSTKTLGVCLGSRRRAATPTSATASAACACGKSVRSLKRRLPPLAASAKSSSPTARRSTASPVASCES